MSIILGDLFPTGFLMMPIPIDMALFVLREEYAALWYRIIQRYINHIINHILKQHFFLIISFITSTHAHVQEYHLLQTHTTQR